MFKKIIFVFLALICPLSIYAEEIKQTLSDELVVGILPRRDSTTTVKLFTPLINHLKHELNIPVRLETSVNFKMFSRRLNNRRYDLVHFNQYQYVRANKYLAYDVIVQNEEFGEKTIKGAIFVHNDSAIKQVSQLRGKTILFGGGKSAMMSYIVPSYLLRKEGLQAGDYEELYAVSPPNAVFATYLRQADAAGAGELVQRLPMVKKKIDTSKIHTLAVSEALPHLPWAVKREMNKDLKEKIYNILINLKHTDKGRRILSQARLTGFNSALNSDYDAHRKIIDQIVYEQ